MRKLTTEQFIEKVKSVHGDKYDYSFVNYINSYTKVCIICPEHGEFWQRPDSHQLGAKCPSCAGRPNTTTESFIDRAKSINGLRYDYSKVEYVNNKTKVCITCKEHGDFYQTPDHHLQGKGCPLCHQGYRDWNFEQPEDYKLIPLTKGKFAKVDNEDFDRVKDINWYVSTRNYVHNDKVGRMHRLILNPPDNMYVDHINNDPLDNRKKNLRICTQHQNTMNQSPQKGKSSIYKGVYWSTEGRKWKAQIVCEGVHNSLGSFKTEEEAGRAYDKKAKELFGEFAKLNF